MWLTMAQMNIDEERKPFSIGLWQRRGFWFAMGVAWFYLFWKLLELGWSILSVLIEGVMS